MIDPNLWLLSFGLRRPHVPPNAFNKRIQFFQSQGITKLDDLFWKLYDNQELPGDNLDANMSRAHFKKYYNEVFVGAGEMKR